MKKYSDQPEWLAAKYLLKLYGQLKPSTEAHFSSKNVDDNDHLINIIVCLGDYNKRLVEIINIQKKKGLPLTYFKELMRLQNDNNFYFGQNSMISGREKELFDLIQTDEIKERAIKYLQSNRGKRPLKIHELFNSYSCGDFLFRHSVNPYSQRSRRSDMWASSMSIVPDNTKHTVKGNPMLDWLCGLEYVQRGEGYCDPKIKLCALDMYNEIKKSKNSLVRDTYNLIVENRYHDYLQYNAAGGTISVKLQFNNAEELHRAASLAQPENRFPYSGKEDYNCYTLKCLPTFEGFVRNSMHIIGTLWHSGCVFDELVLLPDHSLFLRGDIGLSVKPILKAIKALAGDSTDIVERYIHNKDKSKDSKLREIDFTYPGVYVIEPLSGEVLVGSTRSNHKLQFLSANNSAMRSYEQCDNTKDFLSILLEDHLTFASSGTIETLVDYMPVAKSKI